MQDVKENSQNIHDDAVKIIIDLYRWNILINTKKTSIPAGILKEMKRIIDKSSAEK